MKMLWLMTLVVLARCAVSDETHGEDHDTDHRNIDENGPSAVGGDDHGEAFHGQTSHEDDRDAKEEEESDSNLRARVRAVERGVEEEHISSELESSMLRNRSAAHHDAQFEKIEFNPDDIAFPHLTFPDLFHSIDKNNDGKMTIDELAVWVHRMQATSEAHAAVEQWNMHEKADKRVLTFEEFEAVFGTNADAHKRAESDHEQDHKQPEEVENHFLFLHRRWKHCDRDRDNKLTFAEFVDFNFPEDKPYLENLHFFERMEHVDTNKDGNVSLTEYLIETYTLESPIGHFLEGNQLDISLLKSNLVTFPNGSRVDDELFQQVKEFIEEHDLDKNQVLSEKEARLWLLPESAVIPSQAEAQTMFERMGVYSPLTKRSQQKLKKQKPRFITLNKFLESKDVFMEGIATNFGQIIGSAHEEL